MVNQSSTEHFHEGWIRADKALPDSSREVEIAFWDGVLMCRVFGAWSPEDKCWWVGQEKLEDPNEPWLKVTHWQEARKLPDPPEERS